MFLHLIFFQIKIFNKNINRKIGLGSLPTTLVEVNVNLHQHIILSTF